MMLNPSQCLLALLLLVGAGLSYSFLLHPSTAAFQRHHHGGSGVKTHDRPSWPSRAVDRKHRDPNNSRSSCTSLNLLLDVPDGFFTVTFPMLGILLSISKNFGRVRMEERAWEQRLEEARLARLQADPTLTELDLRRQEAALEWSAYGKPRMQQEAQERRAAAAQAEDDDDFAGNRRRKQRRVQVMDATPPLGDNGKVDPRQYRMTEEEIEAFELEYGVEYDPYYDDPYAEDELPEGNFDVDRMYGDRIYENGEIFYKDATTNLYYRQGCKPRNLSFWG